jgi:Protein of unknown function (DUF2934)
MALMALGDGMVEDAGHSLGSGLSPESRRSFLGALLSVGGFFVGALLSVPLIRFALLKVFSYSRSIAGPQFRSALNVSCSYLQVLGSPTRPCKFLKTLVIHTLKRLASAVQLRPWPPSFYKTAIRHSQRGDAKPGDRPRVKVIDPPMSSIFSASVILLRIESPLLHIYLRRRGGPLVDAHVIDQHALRKYGGRVRVSGPVATHRQVEDQEEGLVENPFPSGLKIGARAAHVEILVHVEADGVSVPLNREDVEVVGEALCREFVGCLYTGVADISGSVNRTVNDGGFLADVLHDRRAYEIYLERGEQPGRELDDWLQAERELERGVLWHAQAS